MGSPTKERILEEALVMFATNGYKGTNLRDLAAKLGLSKSALYRHYDSKEEIWNSVLNQMESYYSANFGSADNPPEIPDSIEEFFVLTMRKVDFTVHDPRIILTRQLLTTEQFHDDRVRSLATAHFLTGTQRIYSLLFAGMMEKGLLKKDDPEMLSFAFTSPITALIHLCDREPEQKAAVLKQVESFIRHFLAAYQA